MFKKLGFFNSVFSVMSAVFFLIYLLVKIIALRDLDFLLFAVILMLLLAIGTQLLIMARLEKRISEIFRALNTLMLDEQVAEENVLQEIIKVVTPQLGPRCVRNIIIRVAKKMDLDWEVEGRSIKIIGSEDKYLVAIIN